MTRKHRKYKNGHGMGMSKHRESGNNQISPRLKHAMERDARKNCSKARPTTCIYRTVSDALNENPDTQGE